MVAKLKELILNSRDESMIALLPDLSAAYKSYREDPAWVGGPGFARLMAATEPLLRFLGINID